MYRILQNNWSPLASPTKMVDMQSLRSPESRFENARALHNGSDLPAHMEVGGGVIFIRITLLPGRRRLSAYTHYIVNGQELF